MRTLGILLSTLALYATPTRADVIPEGHRGIEHKTSALLGPKLEGCVVEVVVAEGDSLARLAKKHLGAEGRWTEIAALNGLDEASAAKIAVGQKLLLPPARPGAKTYHLFVQIAYPFRSGPTRLQIGTELPYAKWGLRLCAVEESHVEEFLERTDRKNSKGRWPFEAEGDEAPPAWLATTEELPITRLVKSLSSVRSMSTVFRVDGIEGRSLKVSTRVEERLLGDERRIKDFDGETSGPSKDSLPAAMATLGLGSLGVLLLVGRRRRREG